MLPACLRLADDVFPRVRARAARRLVDAGWSQARTGDALGLSQAMVSKHLATPPTSDALVERLADELAQEALRPGEAAEQSAWCVTLTQAHGRPDADAALQDFLTAERLMLADAPMRVMPQVGLNLALALPNATGPVDVLAFPGRLVDVGGRLVRPAPPAFGGSGHLARVLLALRGRTGHTALANVRGGAAIAAAARTLGWSVQVVDRAANATDEAALLQAIASGREAIDAVHDRGAIGLEPCLYVAGPSAQAVARRILALNNALEDQA